MTGETDIPKLRTELGAPNNQYLFPRHFLEVVLPKLGGTTKITDQGVAFSFPHPDYPRTRFNGYDGKYELQVDGVSTIPEDLIYSPTHTQIAGLDIGKPSRSETAPIRALQQLVWGTNMDGLYPADIHSREFDLPATLVARLNSVVIGFVFGFYDQVPGRMESQIMGVHPDFQGKMAVGFNLKVEQFLQTQKSGISQMSWTYDPLEVANGKLNLNKLGARATGFHSNYYPFSNTRNQVPASRFMVSWKADDPDVGRVLETRSPKSPINPELSDFGDIAIVEKPGIPDSSRIAIPIPPNWQDLQKGHLSEAQGIREKTDAVFEAVVGPFVITTIAFAGKQPYLIGERV